jgi:ATP-dependent exoDNAse (exonuclease V) beta subunit
MTNQRLIANAGSGKTYALTTRMIQLLAQDVRPDKIAALTFTRKSAGEFLSAVFNRLAEAAKDPKKLADLQKEDGLANLDAARCRAMLTKLALHIGRLGMGTIDSLFARIARAFPLESGLAEDFAMAGEAEILSARERTLAALFANESSASLSDFIDLLRRINRTHGERDIFKNLLKETENLHAKFLATPQGSTWGDADVIWENGCAILSSGPVAPVARQLWDAIQSEHPNLRADAFQTWQTGITLAEQHPYPKPLSEDLKNFFKKLSNERSTDDGSIYIPSGNAHAARVFLTPTIRPLRDEMRLAMLKPEFESLLQRSRSLHALMQKFEESYSALVRSAGLVTFGDITDSLARKAGDEAWRLSAGYRIDQKFDHWLLDEFQDTSRPQWKILETFIEEVLTNPEGNRGFFYVGDTKQAIYSWRGGDPNLFFEIFDEFQSKGYPIEDALPLRESYRSCRSILNFVNEVFGKLDRVKSELEIPDATIEKWASAWTEHIVSPKTCDLDGYAEWISIPKNAGDDDEDGDATDRKILQILEATEPWKRGLSCAVLKRDNKAVAALASLLQSKDIPVAVEGKTNPCVDNPLGAAFIAALRLCASPDDKIAAAIVHGFPTTLAWGVGEGWKFRRETLASVAQSGFASTIRQWADASDIANEPFLKERAAAFLLAAEEFDSCRKSSDGIPDFLRFVENRQTQENEASGVVRIMNVHQSKGLGFDMVIVSGLDKKGGGNDSTNLALGPSASEVKWGVLMPGKELAVHDSLLDAQLKIEEADHKFGEICTAYVALTRAKKALYVLTNALGANPTAKNFARHLLLQFGADSASIGNANWYQGHTLEVVATDPVAAAHPFCPPLQGTPKPASPSSFKAQPGEGSGFVSLSQEAAELGTEVHEALAGIEWFESGTQLSENISQNAEKLVRGFLEKPIAKDVFTKPEKPHNLWRERAFDVTLDGQWVSGVFDRVLVHLSEVGEPTSAIIYDFKTDHGSPAEIEERYTGQMEVYCKAICALLRLSPDCVKSQILCVR